MPELATYQARLLSCGAGLAWRKRVEVKLLRPERLRRTDGGLTVCRKAGVLRKEETNRDREDTRPAG